MDREQIGMSNVGHVEMSWIKRFGESDDKA